MPTWPTWAGGAAETRVDPLLPATLLGAWVAATGTVEAELYMMAILLGVNLTLALYHFTDRRVIALKSAEYRGFSSISIFCLA